MKQPTINFAIGSSCFTRCPGCYHHFGGTKKKGGLVTAAEVLDFAAAAKQRATQAGIPFTQATLSGGDPLSHPEVVQIARGLHDLDLVVKMDTVGTAFGRPAPLIFYGKTQKRMDNGREVLDYEYVRQYDLREFAGIVDVLGLTADGATLEQMQLFREGVDSLPDETRRHGLRAKSLGMTVCMNTVVHVGNISHLREIRDFVISCGAKIWQLFEFQPSGPLASENASRFLLPRGEFARETERIQAMTPASVLAVDPKPRDARGQQYFIVNDAGIARITDDIGRAGRVIGHITRDRARCLKALEEHWKAQRRDADRALADLATTGGRGFLTNRAHTEIFSSLETYRLASAQLDEARRKDAAGQMMAGDASVESAESYVDYHRERLVKALGKNEKAVVAELRVGGNQWLPLVWALREDLRLDTALREDDLASVVEAIDDFGTRYESASKGFSLQEISIARDLGRGRS